MGLISIQKTASPLSSLNLLPLAVTLHTQVAKKLNIVVNAGLVCYWRDFQRRRVNKYLFDQSKRRLAQLTDGYP